MARARLGRGWRVTTLILLLLTAALADMASAERSGGRLGTSPAGASFRDCDACPEMVPIPAGSFLMGTAASDTSSRDEEPQHAVTLAPFALGATEVTFAEWDACVAAGGCPLRPGDWDWGRGPQPVINVSWDDTQGYVRWLSQATGQAYRLPTEAEWEYAARAGTATLRFWGDADNEACGFGNVHDEQFGCDDGFDHPAPAGSLAANAFGLHDMLGNVWEWVEDCYTPTYVDASATGAAAAAPACEYRVLRGGSWGDPPATLRSAHRHRFEASGHYYDIGFRVARSLTAD